MIGMSVFDFDGGVHGEYVEQLQVGEYAYYKTPLRPSSGNSVASTVLVNAGMVMEEVEVGHLLQLPIWVPVALYISAANVGAGLLSGKGGLPFALVVCWRGGSSRRSP